MIDLPMIFIFVFVISIIILGRTVFTKIMDIVLYMTYIYLLTFIYGEPQNDFTMLILMNLTAYLMAIITRKIILKWGIKNN